MMPNDARHREFRRLFSEVLNPRWVEELRPLQENKIRNLLKGLLERPDAFREHIPRYSMTTYMLGRVKGVLKI